MTQIPLIESISREVSGWGRLLGEIDESVQEEVDSLRSQAEELEEEADKLEEDSKHDMIKYNLGEAIARERLYGEDVHAPCPYLVFMDQKYFNKR